MVAELEDALALGASVRKDVWVRLPPMAPFDSVFCASLMVLAPPGLGPLFTARVDSERSGVELPLN